VIQRDIGLPEAPRGIAATIARRLGKPKQKHDWPLDKKDLGGQSRNFGAMQVRGRTAGRFGIELQRPYGVAKQRGDSAGELNALRR